MMKLSVYQSSVLTVMVYSVFRKDVSFVWPICNCIWKLASWSYCQL